MQAQANGHPDTHQTTRLHVGHLTRNVSEGHIKEIFSTFGTISSVEVSIDKVRPQIKKERIMSILVVWTFYIGGSMALLVSCVISCLQALIEVIVSCSPNLLSWIRQATPVMRQTCKKDPQGHDTFCPLIV